jgi:hypothetical protein
MRAFPERCDGVPSTVYRCFPDNLLAADRFDTTLTLERRRDTRGPSRWEVISR